MPIDAVEYIGPGFRWRVVRKSRVVKTCNECGTFKGDCVRVRRRTKLNSARLVVRVKALKQLRYRVREVHHEVISDNELAIQNYPARLAFKRLEDAIEAGHLLTRETNIKQAREIVEAKRQSWKA